MISDIVRIQTQVSKTHALSIRLCFFSHPIKLNGWMDKCDVLFLQLNEKILRT